MEYPRGYPRTTDMTEFENLLSDVSSGMPRIGIPDEAELDDHARYDRATFAFETKNYAQAVDLLTPLVASNPGNAEITLLLARSYYHSARLARAESVLQDMVQRWPGDAYAHLLLARTLQRIGRAEEGASHLKLAEAMGLQA